MKSQRKGPSKLPEAVIQSIILACVVVVVLSAIHVLVEGVRNRKHTDDCTTEVTRVDAPPLPVVTDSVTSAETDEETVPVELDTSDTEPEETEVVEEQPTPLALISTDDIHVIATTVFYEAGYCTDRHQQLVAQVILNRLVDESFPDTIDEIIAQRRQYNKLYLTPRTDIPTRVYENVFVALRGEVECPENVVYQSEYIFGSGIYEQHNTSYSSTYFCYK